MGADRELLEDADAVLARPVRVEQRRAGDGLHVDAVGAAGVVDRERQTLATDDRLALPRTVGPFGMAVADAGHVELVQRLEAHGADRVVPADEVVLEPIRPASPRSPLDTPVHR